MMLTGATDDLVIDCCCLSSWQSVHGDPLFSAHKETLRSELNLIAVLHQTVGKQRHLQDWFTCRGPAELTEANGHDWRLHFMTKEKKDGKEGELGRGRHGIPLATDPAVLRLVDRRRLSRIASNASWVTKPRSIGFKTPRQLKLNSAGRTRLSHLPLIFNHLR